VKKVEAGMSWSADYGAQKYIARGQRSSLVNSTTTICGRHSKVQQKSGRRVEMEERRERERREIQFVSTLHTGSVSPDCTCAYGLQGDIDKHKTKRNRRAVRYGPRGRTLQRTTTPLF
jgi:hypothetical protein